MIVISESVLFTFQNLLWYCFILDILNFSMIVFLNYFGIVLMVCSLFSSQTQLFKGVVLGSLIILKFLYVTEYYVLL